MNATNKLRSAKPRENTFQISAPPGEEALHHPTFSLADELESQPLATILVRYVSAEIRPLRSPSNFADLKALELRSTSLA
ncbi:hypothetical protein J5N97_026635 [Dioscorea zingiberensis]|uniref:Uncharacterized protein n=1 Tax=Dioscorea zingiberensis TaxID=325984 RepID=A0A9D5C2M6_9LILI|nr:hypothetical protein J5N97_026635 [Dioscorea zingiberensis]